MLARANRAGPSRRRRILAEIPVLERDSASATRDGHAPPGERPQVEVVVPVRNEECDLGPSIRRLHGFLRGDSPFSAQMPIADNGSTDGTWPLAVALSEEYPGVRALRIDQAGRGRALHAVWGSSDADVLAYMDVDMSTDLNALLPLVAPLLSGHSDLAIGDAARAQRPCGPRPTQRVHLTLLQPAAPCRARHAIL